MLRAELDAIVCSGPRRGKQFTYALLDERVPPARPARDEALAELVRRYFTGHGPAQLTDFAWWSGLTMADAKAGVQMLAATSSRRRRRQALLARRRRRRAGDPVVHLLPNYDDFLIAYKDHGPSVDAALTRGVGPRDAVFANHLGVIDGLVVGGWRRVPGKGGMIVAPTLLRALSAAEKAVLARVCAAYSRFLALPVTLAPARRRAGAAARSAASTGRARAPAR